MKETLIDSCGDPLHGWNLNTKPARGEEMHLCVCVYTAFLLQTSDAGVCSHVLVQPISPFGPKRYEHYKQATD